MKKFDLTTENGLKTAARFLEPSLMSASPVFSLAKLIFGGGPESIGTNQKETVEAIIKRGKESGVDEMEIELNDTTGVKLDIPLEDVKIDTFVGTDRKMKIKVKYK